MEQLLPYLPFIILALACPISMSVMMWYMMRQGGHQQMTMGSTPTQSEGQDLAALRAQKETLEAQIRELEAVKALQVRRDQLARESSVQQE